MNDDRTDPNGEDTPPDDTPDSNDKPSEGDTPPDTPDGDEIGEDGLTAADREELKTLRERHKSASDALSEEGQHIKALEAQLQGQTSQPAPRGPTSVEDPYAGIDIDSLDENSRQVFGIQL